MLHENPCEEFYNFVTRRKPNNAKLLAGRTAIVTGSGRNIGRAIALAYARAGANVALNGHRDISALDAVKVEIEALGSAAISILADVSNPDDVQEMVNSGSIWQG